MTQLLAKAKPIALLLCLLAFGSLGVAQTETLEHNGTDVYRIEILVFAREGEAAWDEERWILPKSLSYPSRLATLQVPTASTTTATTPTQLQASEPQRPAAPETFTSLPAENFKLGSAANRLARQRDMRILAHKAWRQPLFERAKADSVLITGGDKVGEHFELEGYVTVSVERYLHLSADLWLSRFSLRDAGDSSWPLLPPLPFTEPTDSAGAYGFGNNTDVRQLLSDPYRTDRIFVLRESRRMRSGEIHYLDHPRLGLLARIDPVKTPTQPSEPGDSSAQ